MEQLKELEEFLLMDDHVEGGVLDPFWLPGGKSSVLLIDDGTQDDHSINNITSSLDDQWWINHDDDGFIDDGFLFQSAADIPSIPSILSTEQDESINNIFSIDHNYQEAAAAELLFIDNYFTNTDQQEHSTSTTNNNIVVIDDHHQQQHKEELLQQQQQHQTDHQQYANELEKDEEEEEEEMIMKEQAEMGSDGSKNLVSERNRRKRLNTQFFTLRSMVPNITKMDRRSILSDALAYLQSILQQTEDEMQKINSSSTNYVQEPPDHSPSRTSSWSSSTVENMVMEAPPPPPYERCAALPAISKVGVEKLDDDRFILKIAFDKALGAMSQVQRLVQMLGLEITNTSVYEQDEHHLESMNFLRVIKKKGLQVVFTEDDLLHKVQKTAKMLGLPFVTD